MEKPKKKKKGCGRCPDVPETQGCAPVEEKVDHPPHYNKGKIEVIDAIEEWGLGFNDGNVIKYVSRYNLKNKHLIFLIFNIHQFVLKNL